jgi:hypothetical protein
VVTGPRGLDGGVAAAGDGSRTTHFVFAIVLALCAADAEGRRGLGADSVDTLEAWGTFLIFGMRVLIVGHGAAGKWVSDRHGVRVGNATGARDWTVLAGML